MTAEPQLGLFNGEAPASAPASVPAPPLVFSRQKEQEIRAKSAFTKAMPTTLTVAMLSGAELVKWRDLPFTFTHTVVEELLLPHLRGARRKTLAGLLRFIGYVAKAYLKGAVLVATHEELELLTGLPQRTLQDWLPRLAERLLSVAPFYEPYEDHGRGFHWREWNRRANQYAFADLFAWGAVHGTLAGFREGDSLVGEVKLRGSTDPNQKKEQAESPPTAPTEVRAPAGRAPCPVQSTMVSRSAAAPMQRRARTKPAPSDTSARRDRSDGANGKSRPTPLGSVVAASGVGVTRLHEERRPRRDDEARSDYEAVPYVIPSVEQTEARARLFAEARARAVAPPVGFRLEALRAQQRAAAEPARPPSGLDRFRTWVAEVCSAFDGLAGAGQFPSTIGDMPDEVAALYDTGADACDAARRWYEGPPTPATCGWCGDTDCDGACLGALPKGGGENGS